MAIKTTRHIFSLHELHVYAKTDFPSHNHWFEHLFEDISFSAQAISVIELIYLDYIRVTVFI